MLFSASAVVGEKETKHSSGNITARLASKFNTVKKKL
jgi:hypothetical protein